MNYLDSASPRVTGVVFKDDRSPDQYSTHTVLVVGTDSFMSGWGDASGVPSYAAWACRPQDQTKVLAWVKGRSEMKRVRVVCSTWRPKRPSHTHVYVVEDGHPSLA